MMYWELDNLASVSEAVSKLSNLYEAIARGQMQDVEDFLNKHFIDINPINQYQNAVLYYIFQFTALYHVFDGPRDEVDTPTVSKMLQLLIDAGALVNAQNVEGDTPLHLAIEEELTIVNLLLQRGALCNLRNREGQTPLHVAANLGRADAFQLLLYKGADFFIEDNKRRSPQALAKQQRQEAGPYTPQATYQGWQFIIDSVDSMVECINASFTIVCKK